MVFQLIRKIKQVASDRVLQKWLVGRMLGQYHSPDAFQPHHPPFLKHRLPLLPETPSWCILPEELSDRLSETACSIPILAHQQTLDPSSLDAFFKQPSADIETNLARHRFAWLPLTPKIDAAGLYVLWRAWRDEFMDADGWAWHPYTAAERAINLLDGARRCGAPDTLDAFAQDIAAHAPKIAHQLEYFGDHDTSNHLANNGRGLYRIGCALNMPQSRQIGFEILRHEAERIILEGGSLREGSTHYHILYARNYIDVWLAAHRHGHTQEAGHLKEISKRLLAVAKNIVLPGGLPLIGDISPDCPPSYLEGIETGTCPWTQTLNYDEQLLVRALAKETAPATPEQLQGDGWIRADFGRWSMLTSAPSTGWPFMPGHAHQDIGSAEIHFDGQPLFVDPGRGAYGETGEAALYRSAAVHGGLMIDHQNPYPANKPYYSDMFRQKIAGSASSQISSDSVSITHGGYRRLGIETTKRTWVFDDNTLSITDSIQGHGHHASERALVTPHDVKIKGDKVIINNMFIIRAADAHPRITPIKIWNAYGLSTQGSRIIFENAVSQSWTGTITIKASH